MLRIEEFRKKKGFTQENLAKMLGVTPHTVNRWERGHHIPNAIDLQRVARVLGYRVEEFYEETNPPPPSTSTTEKTA